MACSHHYCRHTCRFRGRRGDCNVAPTLSPQIFPYEFIVRLDCGCEIVK
uniref:Uncharacterized protein n=1 Tax=Anguilla anguilla TaxID=7936 RepID=A0A0E9S7C3_ANGAN